MTMGLPVIEGYHFTHHAMERAMERGVHAKWVAEAILAKNAVPGNQPNTAECIGTAATVIVNYASKEVLTVYLTKEWSNR
jgi:hypothetical protein